MPFTIDQHLMAAVRPVFAGRENLYWFVGGAGSGKSTICQALAEQHQLPVYDMDAHIYGSYFGRYSPHRHPVNTAWLTAENGLQWLLSMSWEAYDQFNRAALAEYLDLLAQDLASLPAGDYLLIDGGIWHPALLAQVLPARQIICLSAGERPGAEIWQENEERLAMKRAIEQLPEADEMWRKFLEFDQKITQTVQQESLAHDITVYIHDRNLSIQELAEMVAGSLFKETDG